MLLTAVLFSLLSSQEVTGRLVDSQDGMPITGAIIYTDQDTVYSDINGFFTISAEEDIRISALSYKEVTICPDDCNGTISLSPYSPQNVTIRKRR